MLGAEGAEAHLVGVAQPEIAVDPGQPAVAVEEFAVGERRADVRLGVQVVAHTADERLRGLAGCARHGIFRVARGFVVRVHHAEGRFAGFAGQLRAVPRIDDRARVHDPDRRPDVEYLGALEEERPQLRIEEVEALVHLDLGAIRLDLGKVGIERHVRREVRRDAVLEVDAALRLRIVVDEAARVVEPPELHRRERRQNFDVAAGRQAGHPLQYAHLRKEPGNFTGHWRPDHRLVPRADTPGDLEPPLMGNVPGPLRIAQALERDGDLGGEPVGNDPAGAVEQGVPRRIAERQPETRTAAAAAAAEAAAAPRAHNRVHLHAVGVDTEGVRALLVEERIDVHPEHVVPGPHVAVLAVGAEQLRIREVRVEANVEVGAVVGDIDVGILRRSLAGARRELHELGDADRTAPRSVIQPSVDGRRSGGARRPHRGPPGQDPGARRDAEPRRVIVNREDARQDAGRLNLGLRQGGRHGHHGRGRRRLPDPRAALGILRRTGCGCGGARRRCGAERAAPATPRR